MQYWRGISLSEGILYGLIVAVLALGGFAIVRSVNAQQQTAVMFKGWYEDKKGYDQALADQKATQKPVLVYIYASWCPHCKEFSANVLSDKKVQRFVKQYPHVRIAPDHGAAEKQIMTDFGAEGYPSFYVVSADGVRHTVETFQMGPKPRQKTPDEFIKAVQDVTGGH